MYLQSVDLQSVEHSWGKIIQLYRLVLYKLYDYKSQVSIRHCSRILQSGLRRLLSHMLMFYPLSALQVYVCRAPIHRVPYNIPSPMPFPQSKIMGRYLVQLATKQCGLWIIKENNTVF